MIIESRFHGPDGSGNGGYSAGLLAAALPVPPGHVAEVTLRRPPPLDTPLRLVRTDAGLVAYDGQQLVAQATAVELPDPPVPPVTPAEAARASRRFPDRADHPFPGCYVCGPDRADADGLRIFPGPLPDGRTAAGWQVPAEVDEPTVWAALDCPGGWSVIGADAGAGTGHVDRPAGPVGTGADRPGLRPYLLGRIAARVVALPAPGSRCVVVGSLLERAGRKALVDSAVYRPEPDGGATLLGQARATWLAVSA